jgi:hypothetical protein
MLLEKTPMTDVREPITHPIAITDLRPTQITVGMREVAAKREAWRQMAAQKGEEKAREFLGSHMIPVILGPKHRCYVTDHHHLALALHQEAVEHVTVNVITDLSKLGRDEFWFVLDNRGWTHPFDAEGVRRDVSAIPKSIDELVDDPFRSLAGELRRVGGYAKDTTPFSEFLWADFLRRRMKTRQVEKDFDSAVKDALALAKDEAADHLPGWCGNVAR